MKKSISGVLIARCATLLTFLILSTTSAFADKQSSKAGDSQGRFVLAISEGGSGNLTATDIVFRYEEFKHVVEKAVGVPVLVVAVRDLLKAREMFPGENCCFRSSEINRESGRPGRTLSPSTAPGKIHCFRAGTKTGLPGLRVFAHPVGR